MLLTKFRGIGPLVQEKKIFEGFLPYMGMVAILVTSIMLTLVLRDPYRSGFTMHVCVAGHGSIRDRPVSSFTL